METPEGFGCVEPGLYRAAGLNAPCLPFLASLRLKSILILAPGAPSPAVLTFTSSTGVELVHMGLQPWRVAGDYKASTISILGDAVRYVLDRRHYPLLVIDPNMFVGILRKIQDWTFSAILAEYVAFAGVRANYNTEVFLELLKVRLIPDYEEMPTPERRELIVRLPPQSILPEWFKVYCSMRDNDSPIA